MRLVIAALVGLAALVTTAAAADTPIRTLTMTGSGSASAAPDLARITTAVETVAGTAAIALSLNARAAASVLDALRDQGIAEADIQTSQLSIQPRYSERKSNTRPEITAYVVTNALTITIRDIAVLGEILDTAITRGANRMQGISFGFSDQTDLIARARRDAVADAIRAARTHADAAGITLGPILSLSDGSAPVGPRRDFAAREMSTAAIPIAIGEASVSATVRIVWQIAD